MAIKDEYEVARLYTDGSFARQLVEAVPELRPARIPSRAADPRPARRGRQARESRASAPWMMKGFRLLAALKGLRGTAFDLFGYTRRAAHGTAAAGAIRGRSRPDRRSLAPGKIEAAAALASVPALIRGYGHVKQASASKGRRPSGHGCSGGWQAARDAVEAAGRRMRAVSGQPEVAASASSGLQGSAAIGASKPFLRRVWRLIGSQCGNRTWLQTEKTSFRSTSTSRLWKRFFATA